MASAQPIDLTRAMASITPEQRVHLEWQRQWRATARPTQIVPVGGWTECGILAGRGYGKDMALDTPIPTPSGWKLLRDIVVGDELFDERGAPTKVLATFDTNPERAYRLTFSDSSTLDAGEGHQWITWTHRDRRQWSRYGKKSAFPDDWASFRGELRDCYGNVTGAYGPEVRTTQEVVDSFRLGTRGDLNHCIPTTAPLQCPEVALPVAPYTLGLWLGNGTARDGTITQHPDDFAALTPSLSADGFPPRRVPTDSSDAVPLIGLSTILRRAGLLNNKHVPAAYLRASIGQRLALLRGLMDSDGGVDNAHSVSFSNTNEGLIDGLFELAVGLGEKPKKEARQTYCTYKGRRVAGAPSWRVYWTPARFIPFTLPRKAGRIALNGAQSKRNRHRMISSFEEIAPAPMRCLTVDSPNSLFLAGKGMIPTHNTRVGAEWMARAAFEDTSGFDSYVIAPTYQDVKFTCFEGESGILSVLPHSLLLEYNKSDLFIKMRNVGGGTSTIRGFTAEKPERLRGPQATRAWMDELAAWQYDEETWDMAMMGLRLGPHPQVLWTTTPKPKDLIRKLTAPQAGRLIVRGSTYDNKANLPQSFFDNLAQYEGTAIGRQELHGELIDPEESGIVKRSDFRLWPAKKPLPALDYIILSLDTAFTEETYDKKRGDPDATACVVVGSFHDKENNSHLIVLDCWSEQMGMPDLIKRVKRELNVAYGDDQDVAMIKPMYGSGKPITSGRKPDLCLIEDKGSGISLRQMLERDGISAYAYNPGRADKLARLHMVSHIFARKRVWLPESDKFPGRPRTWVEPMLAQLCAFTGPNSVKHDDYVDAMTQVVRLCVDKRLVSVIKAAKPGEVTRLPPKVVVNPYSQ